ncbi:MAG: helix-turn-helix domain-containing protein [Acidimicrobiales bacterium]
MTSATDSDRPDWAGCPAKPVSPATEDDNEPRRLLLTAEEAAQVLGVGRTTVYGMLRTGQLASVRIGSARRVSVRRSRSSSTGSPVGLPHPVTQRCSRMSGIDGHLADLANQRLAARRSVCPSPAGTTELSGSEV